MSNNTIDCSSIEAIVRAFSPGAERIREGLAEAIRMYGAHRYEAGEKAGLKRARDIFMNNSVAKACFRLQEIVTEDAS